MRRQSPGSAGAVHEVELAPEAQDDIDRLYLFIAADSGSDRAQRYITRILTACAGLANFPQRGTPRDNLREGMRVIGLDKRVAIAFKVEGRSVTVLRILYGGRDLGGAFAK